MEEVVEDMNDVEEAEDLIAAALLHMILREELRKCDAGRLWCNNWFVTCVNIIINLFDCRR